MLEQGVEVKDADSLGDPGGDEQLLVAIKLDAADHAVAGVVGAVRRDGRQLAELTVLGVHREDSAEGVESGPGAFRGVGRDEIFESLSLLPWSGASERGLVSADHAQHGTGNRQLKRAMVDDLRDN